MIAEASNAGIFVDYYSDIVFPRMVINQSLNKQMSPSKVTVEQSESMKIHQPCEDGWSQVLQCHSLLHSMRGIRARKWAIHLYKKTRYLLILDTKDVASPGNAEIIANHLSKGYAAFESYLEILEHAGSVHQSRQRKALYHNKGESS